MREKILRSRVSPFVLAATVLAAGFVQPAAAENIMKSTLMESGQVTSEISTEDLKAILASKSATVFDARPAAEFSISHIPGAVNVAPKPGMPMSLYTSDVAEVGRLLKDDRSAPIVMYCNGPFCGKSKRLSEELIAAGYTNVRRYQLGIPVWRALVGLTQIEEAGFRYVRRSDLSSVFVDARSHELFATGSLQRARNIPLAEVKAAKDDGRLPMDDHNTRIIVFAATGTEARAVANEIAKNAFHNVAFYDGGWHEVRNFLGLDDEMAADSTIHFQIP